MDTAPIRYATSEDGTDIAYMVAGSGPPLLVIDQFFDLGLDLRIRSATAAPFLSGIAATRTIIIFDWRNFGLSGTSKDFSMETCIADIEAVVRQEDLSRFDVWSRARAANVALAFTALHPEFVRRLAIGLPYPSGVKLAGLREASRVVADLVSYDWPSFTNEFSLGLYGWTEAGRVYAEQIRKNWTPDKFIAFDALVAQLEGFSSAARIKAPALVIEREADDESVRMAARRLAALLPNSHLVIASVGTVRDPALVPIIDSFLGSWEDEQLQPLTDAHSDIPFRTIVFTDLESHTETMRRLGDSKGRELLREHERLTRVALADHSGTEVKTMGDGFMASFGSAQKAIECAVALQRAFAAWAGEPIRVRVGINAGEPIAEDDDLFGASVILAARTAARANGGQILVTDVVRQLVAGKGFAFADRGEFEIKGFDDRVRLFEVHWA